MALIRASRGSLRHGSARGPPGAGATLRATNQGVPMPQCPKCHADVPTTALGRSYVGSGVAPKLALRYKRDQVPS